MNTVIALSVYNGERYLPDQLDSILRQTEQNFIIYIRDDGSTDGSNSIINKYSKNSHKIKLVTDSWGNIGSCKSFEKILSQIDLEENGLIFLCDQDDVWDSDKIASYLKLYKKIDNNLPQLIYSDMHLLNDTTKSDHTFYSIYPIDKNKLLNFSQNILCNQNYIPGCFSAFNSRLLKNALPFPSKTLTHDWWINLIASYTGEIHFIKESKGYYRIHSSNQIGLTNFNPKKIYKNFKFSFEQVHSLSDRLKKLNLPISPVLSNYLDILDSNSFLTKINKYHKFNKSKLSLKKLVFNPLFLYSIKNNLSE